MFSVTKIICMWPMSPFIWLKWLFYIAKMTFYVAKITFYVVRIKFIWPGWLLIYMWVNISFYVAKMSYYVVKMTILVTKISFNVVKMTFYVAGQDDILCSHDNFCMWERLHQNDFLCWQVLFMWPDDIFCNHDNFLCGSDSCMWPRWLCMRLWL